MIKIIIVFRRRVLPLGTSTVLGSCDRFISFGSNTLLLPELLMESLEVSVSVDLDDPDDEGGGEGLLFEEVEGGEWSSWDDEEFDDLVSLS